MKHLTADLVPRFFARRDIYYGWAIVGLSFLLLCVIFGVRLSFGIFFEALTSDGEFNWSRTDTAGVFSVTMVIFALCGAPAGWLLDRLGPHLVFPLGLAVMGTGLIATSRMQNLTHFYLFYGVWTGIGITILGLSIHAATISRWFARTGRRGLAIGIAFSGTGVGILILAPVIERVITLAGWRSAFLFLAGLLLLGGIPLTVLLMRNDPGELGLRVDSRQPPLLTRAEALGEKRSPDTRAGHWRWSDAARTPAFWLMMLAGCGSLFTLRMVTVHQVAHFVDNGIPRLTAATVFGGAGFITALSFIFFGRLSDRLGRTNTFYIGSAAQVSAIALLLSLRPGASFAVLYSFAILWGIGEGSRSGLLTAIASDLFPGPAMGAIVGTLGAFFGLGAALGSWLGGLVFDWTGSYLPAFQTALAMTVAATAALFFVKRLRPES